MFAEIVLIFFKNVLLFLPNDIHIIRLDKPRNDIREPAYTKVFLEVAEHGVVRRLAYGFLFLEAFLQVTDDIFVDSLRPQKFLEIHGFHINYSFKTGRDAFSLFTVVPLNTKQGSRTDDVVAAVFHKRLDAGAGVCTFLNFIEDDDCLVFDKMSIGKECRKIYGNPAYVQVAVKDSLCVFVFLKVDIDDVLVVATGEFQNAGRFANLAHTLDYQGLLFAP